MYLTAHRVRRSAPMREDGINAILHAHGTSMVPRDPMGKIDIQLVADQNPGDVVASECDLAPGGNHVLSLLDVAFDDAAGSPDLLVAAFQRFERSIRDSAFSPRPVFMIVGADVSLRFANYNRGANLDIDEFIELRDRILSLYRQGREGAARRPVEPLRAEVTVVEGQLRIRLDEASKNRVVAVHRGRFLASGFLMDEDNWSDFISAHGREELMNVVVTSITGMTPEEVVTLAGGVAFFRGGIEAMRWPSDKARLNVRRP